MEFCDLFDNSVICEKVFSSIVMDSESIIEFYRLSCLHNNTIIKKHIIKWFYVNKDNQRDILFELKKKKLLSSFLKDYTNNLWWGTLCKYQKNGEWLIDCEELMLINMRLIGMYWAREEKISIYWMRSGARTIYLTGKDG